MPRRDNLPGARPRRRLLRVVLFTAVALAIATAGLLCLVWFKPIRSNWLHEKILSGLRRAAEVDISYDSAMLDLPHRLYEFRNLRFSDPRDPGKQLLQVESLALRIRPLALFAGGQSIVREMEITRPSLLDVHYDRTGFHLGPKLAFLAKTAHRSSGGKGATSPLDIPMDEFRIKDAKIEFSELTTSSQTGQREIRTAAVLVGDLSAHSDHGKVIAEFTGTGFAPSPADDQSITGRPIASGLSATASLQQRQGRDEMHVAGTVATASISDLFSELPGTAASVSNLEFQIASDRSRESSDINITFDAEGLDISSTEHGIDIHDDNVKGQMHTKYLVPNALIEIQDAQASSSLLAAATSGTLSIESPYSFRAGVVATRLGGGYRKLLTRYLPRGWTVTSHDDAIKLDAMVAGSSSNISSAEGRLRFASLAVTTPHLKQPLRELSGEIDLVTDTLIVHQLSGRHGETELSLNGDISGDFLSKREGQINLHWNTNSTPDDLRSLVDAEQIAQSKSAKGARVPATLPKPQSHGTITGSGTYQQFVSLADGSKTLAPQIEGNVVVHGAGLTHRSLPAPLENLNGTMHIDGDRLVIDSLAGNVRDTKVQVSGLLKGHGVFWQDPNVSATVVSQLDLAQMVTYLPQEQKQIIMKNRISGQATTRLALNGTLKQIADARLAGSVQLHNVALQPSLEFMEGGFTGLDGEVEWDGRALQLHDLRGKLNGETIFANGMLSAQAVSLDLDGITDLGNVLKTFPHLGKWLEMSGPAKYDVKFGVGEEPQEQATGRSPLPIEEDEADTSNNRLISLVAQLTTRIEQAVASKTFTLRGKVEFQGCTMRHRAMPMERVEGRKTIPRGEVRNMRGIAFIENDTFRIADNDAVDCDFSDTRNCRLSGSLQLRHDNLPKMSVRISSSGQLQLDSWITGWGMELPKTPDPLQTGKTFDLDATIAAPSIIYKGQKAGASSARVGFKLVQNDSPRRTTFSDVIINGNQPGLGKLRGSGYIDSFVWRPSEYPKWHTEVDVDRMPLGSMLIAVFKEPTTLSGIATGRIELDGIGSDSQRIRGGGAASLSNLIVGATPVFQQIGQQTGRTFGGTLFETANAVNFQVENGALISGDVKLQTRGLSMDLNGRYYFAANPQAGIPEKSIMGMLKLNILQSVFGKIPILGPFAKPLDDLTGMLLLAFRVSGTADQPNITFKPLPPITGGLAM